MARPAALQRRLAGPTVQMRMPIGLIEVGDIVAGSLRFEAAAQVALLLLLLLLVLLLLGRRLEEIRGCCGDAAAWTTNTTHTKTICKTTHRREKNRKHKQSHTKTRSTRQQNDAWEACGKDDTIWG